MGPRSMVCQSLLGRSGSDARNKCDRLVFERGRDGKGTFYVLSEKGTFFWTRSETGPRKTEDWVGPQKVRPRPHGEGEPFTFIIFIKLQ